MKKFLILTIAMISLFVFAEESRAGTLVEPSIGMHLNSNMDNSVLSEKKDISGTAIGGRLGFQNLGFMAGLAAKKGTFKIDDVTTNDELEYTQYGLFVGYDFPILLRVWVESIMGGAGSTNDSKGEFTAVSGSNIGIGYKAFPFVSINLEIGNATYKKYEFDDGTTMDMSAKMSTFLLSVSLPLSL
jgi:hypothetical protein